MPKMVQISIFFVCNTLKAAKFVTRSVVSVIQNYKIMFYIKKYDFNYNYYIIYV